MALTGLQKFFISAICILFAVAVVGMVFGILAWLRDDEVGGGDELTAAALAELDFTSLTAEQIAIIQDMINDATTTFVLDQTTITNIVNDITEIGGDLYQNGFPQIVGCVSTQETVAAGNPSTTHVYTIPGDVVSQVGDTIFFDFVGNGSSWQRGDGMQVSMKQDPDPSGFGVGGVSCTLNGHSWRLRGYISLRSVNVSNQPTWSRALHASGSSQPALHLQPPGFATILPGYAPNPPTKVWCDSLIDRIDNFHSVENVPSHDQTWGHDQLVVSSHYQGEIQIWISNTGANPVEVDYSVVKIFRPPPP